MKSILLCAGTRPNFMKIAPIYHEAKAREYDIKILHTGQHHDQQMSGIFFEQLGLPEPDINLGINGLEREELLRTITQKTEEYIIKIKPKLVITVGDVNSTLACTIAAKNAKVKVAHIEAGLRSGDMEMPEEINRIETDKICDYKFCTEPDAILNLKKENLYQESKTFLVGNLMIDSLISNMPHILSTTNNFQNKYIVTTLHRPSNVDDKERLEKLLSLLNQVNKKIKVIFAIHPRTKARIEEFGLTDLIIELQTTEPLGYYEFIKLVMNAQLVLTDSGGIQEETTYLGVPCITMRSNTERPITISQGTSYLAGDDINLAKYCIELTLKDKKPREKNNIELWDGQASKRILNIFDTIL